MYSLLTRLLPTQHNPPPAPRRIVLILPCCIGDVVLGTATLRALRRAYPDAHITWAVGSWSKAAISQHDALDAVLDVGPQALPVKSLKGFVDFVGKLRAGRFDLAVSLVRSPLMGAAVLLAGIPHRAGLDSAGRGFGYNLRASIIPTARRHEAEIYLDVAKALRVEVSDCWANIPVHEADLAHVQAMLSAQGITGQFMVANPAGGSNPGMVMDAKRYPPAQFAALLERLRTRYGWPPVLVAGPNDSEIIAQVQAHLNAPVTAFIGTLNFGQIAALASLSALYVGNDTGLTHLAAATGARTVMILGPSDPQRYAPYTPNSLALWQESSVSALGVAGGMPAAWDWQQMGISVEDAFTRITAFIDVQR